MLDERFGKELLCKLIRNLEDIDIYIPEDDCIIYSFNDYAEILYFIYKDCEYRVRVHISECFDVVVFNFFSSALRGRKSCFDFPIDSILEFIRENNWLATLSPESED